MCNCIENLNEHFGKEFGAHLEVPFQIDPKTGEVFDNSRIRVPLYGLDPKNREILPVVRAFYCPFCGEEHQVGAEFQKFQEEVSR